MPIEKDVANTKNMRRKPDPIQLPGIVVARGLISLAMEYGPFC